MREGFGSSAFCRAERHSGHIIVGRLRPASVSPNTSMQFALTDWMTLAALAAENPGYTSMDPGFREALIDIVKFFHDRNAINTLRVRGRIQWE